MDAELITHSAGEMPFRIEPSLVHLIGYWERLSSQPDSVGAALARVVLEALSRVPALREPIADPGILRRHGGLLDVLMAPIFPPALRDQEHAAALVPFDLRSVYATPAFERTMMSDRGFLRGRINVDPRTGFGLQIQHACAAVLEKFYGITLDLEYPLVFTVRDPDTGLDRHFRMTFDPSFLSVEAVGEVPILTEEERAELRMNLGDPWAMLRILPADRFLFRGFSVFRAIDVTDQEILSALKHDLIDRESIVAGPSFRRLQERLQAFFRRPALGLGLAALDGDRVFLLNSSYRLEHGCIFADSTHCRASDFAGSVYERAVVENRPVFVEDLAALPDRGPVEQAILDKGLRSLIVAPLQYQDRVIGTLELGSPHPSDLNATQAMRLREVLPLFSMAVKRSMDELNTRVQAFIKERFTAIHPSVEWRFRQAVLRALESGGPGAPADLEPIVFEDVYPLYAATDIRGSSTQRNLAIQADLATHLRLARDVARAAHRAKDLPILDELAWQIEQRAQRVEAGLTSGDELTVIGFLRERVEPVFAHVEDLGGEVRDRLGAYRAALDPRLGTVYDRRRAFEESVGLVNDTVAAHLDAEEERAQAMVPHYFEKQKTDGVEWVIYAGAAILERGTLDPLLLRNLRLWQLMALCRIARATEALKPRLAVPLETTHLVLAQHAPLAFRFRMDEKRFDVDGAYNMRYEVIKKRIDKAELRGTRERLTQPGRVAIVYAQPREAAEYREYIEYLQGRGDLLPGVEDVELEPLQGVDGLRALRVAVNPESREAREPAALRSVGRG